MLQVQSPFQQFFDLEGDPLDDGSIYIGTAGQNPETNPIAVFWDELLTLPAVQPLKTLNGYLVRGGTPARVYTDQEDFSLTIRNKKLGAVLSVLNATSVSNLTTQLAAQGGSSLVGFVQLGTGAVPRTQESKDREQFSITDFGAIGDGDLAKSAANTVAMQKAIDALLSLGGGDLIIPLGRFAHGDLFINWTNSPIRIIGEQYNAQGGFGCELIYTGTGVAITFTGNGAPYNGYTIENVKIRATNVGNSWALKFDKSAHTHVRHAYLKGFGNVSGGGIYCTGLNNSIDQTEWVDIEDVFFDDCFDGIYSDNTDANAFNIKACFFAGMRGTSIRGDNGGGAHVFGFQRWNIDSNRFYSNTTNDFIKILGGARGLSVSGNYFENNTGRCACLYANGPLKSTGISFNDNNINVDPRNGGGVVEVGYCDNLLVESNTMLTGSAGGAAMVRLLTDNPFGVDNYTVHYPGLPVGGALAYTVRTNSGVVYGSKVVTNQNSYRLNDAVFAASKFEATVSPLNGWGIDLSAAGFTGIAPGASIDLAAGGGVVILHSDTSNTAAMFLCYGTTVTKIDGDTKFVSGVPAAGQVGVYYNAGVYRITNQQVFTDYIYTSLARTRPTA